MTSCAGSSRRWKGSGRLTLKRQSHPSGSLRFRLLVAVPRARPGSQRSDGFGLVWLGHWFGYGSKGLNYGRAAQGIPGFAIVV